MADITEAAPARKSDAEKKSNDIPQYGSCTIYWWQGSRICQGHKAFT